MEDLFSSPNIIITRLKKGEEVKFESTPIIGTARTNTIWESVSAVGMHFKVSA